MPERSAGIRKLPRQSRSEQTVDTILEAASQVQAAMGEAGFTTTSVAERAGVSIGTLYQYFPNRDALLLELARRDNYQIAGLMQTVGQDDAALRGFVRALVAVYRRRIGARRQFAVMAEQGFERPGFVPTVKFPELVEEIWRIRGWAGDNPVADRARAVVLVRAVAGVLRAAALQDGDLLARPEFEEALMSLIRATFRINERRDGVAGAPPPLA